MIFLFRAATQALLVLRVQKAIRAIPDRRVQLVLLAPQVHKDRKVFRGLKAIQEIQARKDRLAPRVRPELRDRKVHKAIQDRRDLSAPQVRKVHRAIRVLQAVQQPSLSAQSQQVRLALAPLLRTLAQAPLPFLISAFRRVLLELQEPQALPDRKDPKDPKVIPDQQGQQVPLAPQVRKVLRVIKALQGQPDQRVHKAPRVLPAQLVHKAQPAWASPQAALLVRP